MLTGRTMLVLGYGAVGRRIARIASSLGMRVIGVRRRAVRDRSETDDVLDELHGVEMLHDLLPRADVLGVCLPFTEQTDGLIGAEEIALLPERAILVNVGRGEIVDETALFEALSDGRLAAAGIDVWYQYPASEAERGRTPPASMPFGELENVVLSPHRGGGFGAAEVEESRVRELAKLINAAARGEPMPNRVHIERGY
jgi:phosphoglycerate dehydrogenase-like enzyme